MPRFLTRLLAILAALLAAAAGFYYFYWMKTPQYAAGEIQQAVERRDYQLFRERVDLDSVYGHALDDLIADTEASDQGKHQLAAGLMKMLKKPLTEEMIRQTEQAFQKKGGQPDQSPLAAAVRTAKAYTGSAALSLTDIFQLEEKDGQTIAHVRLHDSDLGRDFIWQVQMEKDVNGLWTATRIVNLRDYLKERKAAIRATE